MVMPRPKSALARPRQFREHHLQITRTPTSFHEVVRLFKPAWVLAEICGVRRETTKSWRDRNNIPSIHWPHVIVACGSIGRHEITIAMLLQFSIDRAVARVHRVNAKDGPV
jgi:hypothetical protein